MTLVSSANNFIQALGAQFPMSFTYRRNNNGPKTDSWGTPQVILPKSVKYRQLWHIVSCSLSSHETNSILHIKHHTCTVCTIKFYDLQCQKPSASQEKTPTVSLQSLLAYILSTISIKDNVVEWHLLKRLCVFGGRV